MKRCFFPMVCFTIYMDKPVGLQIGQIGNQNSRLVNFVPESRLPFARIGFIDRNTAC